MKQILVVGSDPKISSELDRYLDQKEFRLLVCPQSQSAIPALMNAQPELVIFAFDSMDDSALEIIQKIKELSPDLPMIILSFSPSRQLKSEILEGQIYGWITSPVQIEKLASMVKQALSSLPAKSLKVWHGSTQISSHDKGSIRPGNNIAKSSKEPHSPDRNYHQLFEQTLSPIFDQIIRDCRGHIYERLLSGLEKTMISEVLKSVNHNQVKASKLLGVSRNTLRERMKRFEIF